MPYNWKVEAERKRGRNSRLSEKSGIASGVTERTETTDKSDREKDYQEERSLSSLSLPVAIKLRISDAIKRTISRLPWQRGLFEYARMLKPIAAGYSIDSTNLSAFEAAVRAWHNATGHEHPFEEAWSEFIVAWPKIKCPAGEGLLEAISIRLDDSGLWPKVYQESRSNKLLALCWELSRAAGDGVFYLSVRKAEEVCGFPDRMTAWRRMKMLTVDGWIQEVQAGTTTKATRYKFLRNL
jgi:hypothetical protein